MKEILGEVGVVITALLALSGWGKIFFDWIAKRPKLKTSILGTVMGHTVNKNDDQHVSTFNLDLFIVNERAVPVGIVDWECEIAVGGRPWLKLDRVYGMRQLEKLTCSLSDGGNLVFKGGDFLLPLEQSVTIDKAAHGWVAFFGPASLYGQKIDSIRVTIIDTQGARHVRDLPPSADRPPGWLREVTGLEIPGSRAFESQ
jgi:hypothetical protein